MAAVRKVLCVPCREKLKEAGCECTWIANSREKITCDNCGKRRYGAEYQVSIKRGGKKDGKDPE